MRGCWILIATTLALSGCAQSGAAFCEGTVNVRTKPATARYIAANDREHGEDVAANNRYRRSRCR